MNDEMIDQVINQLLADQRRVEARLAAIKASISSLCSLKDTRIIQ